MIKFFATNVKKLPDVHPVFQIPFDYYVWHGEITYNTRHEKTVQLVNDFESVRAGYEARLATDPEFFQLYVLLAHVVWRTYRLRYAKRMFDAILTADPKHSDTWFVLGQMHEDELDQPEHALNYYRRYLSLEPRHIPPNNYFLDGWWIDLHSFQPSSIEAWTRIGDIRRDHFHDLDGAGLCYEHAISLAPEHHQAPCFWLADVFMAQERNLSFARQLYLKTVDNFNRTKWYNPGVYQNECDYHESLEEWAKRRYPLYSHTGLGKVRQLIAGRIETLGYRSLENGKYSLALECFGRNATTMSRQVHETRIRIVFDHFHDYWQVRFLCQKLLDRYPDNAVANEYLWKVKRQLGY